MFESKRDSLALPLQALPHLYVQNLSHRVLPLTTVTLEKPEELPIYRLGQDQGLQIMRVCGGLRSPSAISMPSISVSKEDSICLLL